MRDIFKIVFMIFLFIFVCVYKNNIANFITENIIYHGSNKVLTYNEYYLKNNYLYVQNTDIKEAKSYQDILNIIYTTINSGDDCYSFKCSYNECLNDIKNIRDKTTAITDINNFVHPFNSFYALNLNINKNNKEITLTIKKLYSQKEIDYINNYIEDFVNKNINLSMTDYDKIKVFHDHIVDITTYDEKKTFDSYTAYNLLTTHISICGGYSDIMSIYLNYLGIKNYKIASSNHIWNLVELNNTWYHLDTTWNDPIASDGKQYLIHNFFMISTKELFELDKVEHNYDDNVYLEANI